MDGGWRSAGGATVAVVAGSDTPTPANVVVRRSARRKRTVSAYRDGDQVVVLIPAGFSAAEEARWVADMVGRLARQDDRHRRPRRSDAELMRRAAELSRLHLEGRAVPRSVRWVTNQNQRWGSCTPLDGSIRLSVRLQAMPAYVVDYVLVHELAHLIVSGHGERFWAWLARYPLTERARGYLEGVQASTGLVLDPDWDVG